MTRAVVLLIAFLMLVCPCRANPLVFGALQTDPKHLDTDYRAGLRLATIELGWNRYEPKAGEFDPAYVAEIRARMKTFRDAGMKLVLDLGMQYPPAWVTELPHARYLNQHGVAYAPKEIGFGGVNAVFNQAIRDRQAYVERVMADLGTDFFAVRLGWGYFGELNFPTHAYEGKTNCYWAYDDLAQGKAAGLPPGIKPCPVPGRRPGDLSTDNAAPQRFIDWYLNALRDYHDWQIATVRKHYAGRLPMLYPSWGLRPGQLDSAVRAGLNGSTPAEQNGELQRGFDFARFIAGVRDPNVIVYTTWLDSPPAFSDESSADPARWSPVHYLAHLAQQHNPPLKLWGENTGRGDLAAMKLSFDRMRTYGLIGLMWAFEEDLHSGKYATIQDFERSIDGARK